MGAVMVLLSWLTGPHRHELVVTALRALLG
jgi:hypothetical protein